MELLMSFHAGFAILVSRSFQKTCDTICPTLAAGWRWSSTTRRLHLTPKWGSEPELTWMRLSCWRCSRDWGSRPTCSVTLPLLRWDRKSKEVRKGPIPQINPTNISQFTRCNRKVHTYAHYVTKLCILGYGIGPLRDLSNWGLRLYLYSLSGNASYYGISLSRRVNVWVLGVSDRSDISPTTWQQCCWDICKMSGLVSMTSQ